jgi:hypothetical protein
MLGIEVLSTGEGRALITASRPSQYSYFRHEQPRTFFGQALIDGLCGHASGTGGYIGLYELYQHLYTNVKAAAMRVNGTQEPVLTIQQGVGPFPVARFPGSDPDTLNAGAIQPEPPDHTAVEVVDPVIVRAIRQGGHAFTVTSGGDTAIDQSQKVIDFGGATIHGNVTTGNVAGRDIIDIKVNTADAAAIDSKADLLNLIDMLLADLNALKDVPADERDDAADELRKARKAGEEGKSERLLTKLESAQKIMLALSGSIPAALKLGDTIGVLIQRAMSL